MAGLIIELKKKAIYHLGFDGATGKTCIGAYVSHFNQMARKEVIRFITYDKSLSTAEVIDKVQSFSGDYLVLDRLDLYINTRLLECIKNKNCYILIDLKNNKWLAKLPINFAKVTILEDGVSVSDLC